MAEPFDTDPHGTFGADAARAKDDLNARFQDLRRDAEASARSAADSVSDRHRPIGGDGMGAAAAGIRDQAGRAADEAKGAASSIAEQARARLNDMLRQQKAAGADRIAGVAQAAHSAAVDLDKTNPQMARLVRTAAENVDKIADDVRSRDIGQVFSSLADFGRKQPVAFFGGAVLAGFVLSRFLKSDVPMVDEASLYGDRRV